MKTYRELIYIKTEQMTEIVNITEEVSKICKISGINDGLVLIFPLHTSCAVYLSDADPLLTEDYKTLTEKLIPEDIDYRHNYSDYKKNATAHLKTILTGHHITLPLTQGSLDLGLYQTIYYAEFDGKREKEILVKIIGV